MNTESMVSFVVRIIRDEVNQADGQLAGARGVIVHSPSEAHKHFNSWDEAVSFMQLFAGNSSTATA